MVNLLNHVAAIDPGRRCCTGGINPCYDYAVRCGGQVQLLGDFRSQILHFDPLNFAAARVVGPFGCLLVGRQFPKREVVVLRFAVAPNVEFDGRARSHLRNVQPQIVGIVHGLTVQLDDHVALVQACFCRRSVRRNVSNQNAAALVEVK